MKKYVLYLITGIILITTLVIFQVPAIQSNARGELEFQLDGDVLVKYIGDDKSVSIPSVVKEIGDGAFAGNSKLTKVKIPSSVEQIDYGAFYGCTNLKGITIPNSVETVETGAFAECTSLKSAKIGSGLKNWGAGVFAGDVKLSTLKIDSNNKYYKVVNGVVYDDKMETLVHYSAGKNTKDYTIPYGVKRVAPYAFWGCSNLVSVSITGMVNEIGPYAFSNCNSITNVYFSPSVKNIDRKSFENCSSLTEVKLPDYVETIHETAFDGCENLLLKAGESTESKTFSEKFNNRSKSSEITLEEIEAKYETKPIGSNTIGERTDMSDQVEGNGKTDQDDEVNYPDENSQNQDLGKLLGSTRVVGNKAVVLIDTSE